jgi:tRNA(His) guanylyltransferase
MVDIGRISSQTSSLKFPLDKGIYKMNKQPSIKRSIDALGDRIKGYEARETERRALPGLPLVVRVDGRSFSRFTKGMARPFDQDFANLMVDVTKYLVEETQAEVGYVQSDEISLIMDPFGRKRRNIIQDEQKLSASDKKHISQTEFMFDGRFQKLTSVIAGMATARFILGAITLWPERVARTPPTFDCRVFEVPNQEEAINSILWREIDATKNAVSMAARAHFSHSRLQDKSSSQMQEMLWQEHGINFNDYPARFKRGAYVQRRVFEKELDAETLAKIPEGKRPTGPVLRSETIVLDLPPIRKLANRVEVLLEGTSPILIS